MTIDPDLSPVPPIFDIDDHKPSLEEDAVLWRYMDLPRFMALLSDKRLHFASACQLKKEDQWEAIIPEREIEAIKSRFAKDAELRIGNLHDVLSRGRVLSW